jgi:transposase
MPVYSQDLRKRVFDTLERREGSLRQIARRFLVSLSFVTRLLEHRRLTGSLEPKPHGGGRPPALGPDDLERLRNLIHEKPDATLEELRQSLGVTCSLMAISRAVRDKLKITRKKKDLHAQERDNPKVERKRDEFREEVAGFDPQRLVFVDESGANTAMTRTYGRAPVGERVHGAAPGHWDTVTLICGLRLSGVTAPVIFEGATDTAAFESYVEQVLVPQLRPGDVVIWDNLKPHKAKPAVEAVERAGACVVPLPPWSPDLTPIEEMFSKVKGALRSAAARTTGAVYEAIGSALHDVSPEDISGWFQSRAAYAIQS